jgi:hypothetical protein
MEVLASQPMRQGGDQYKKKMDDANKVARLVITKNMLIEGDFMAKVSCRVT